MHGEVGTNVKIFIRARIVQGSYTNANKDKVATVGQVNRVGYCTSIQCDCSN